MAQKRMNLFMLLMALEAKGEKESPGTQVRGVSVWCVVKPFCGTVIWCTFDLFFY